MQTIQWQITREGRAWAPDEALARHNLLPEPTKIEMHQGKLFWSDEERLLVVAMLLENLGIDNVLPLINQERLLEAVVAYTVDEENLNEVLNILRKLKPESF